MVLAQVPSIPVFNPVDFVAEILVTVAVVVALIFLWQYSQHALCKFEFC